MKLPKEKETTLELYVTAKEACGMWAAQPEAVKIIDVRTTEEFLFVGHPAMAWNIPAFLQSYEWDASGTKLPMKPNAEFIAAVKQIAGPDDMLLLLCRSGGRSAMAVNALAKAGFKNVFNIVDGAEGDTVDDPDSVFLGQRMRNGWKNAGLPWSCDLDPDRVVLPKLAEKATNAAD